jgi:hypothetical protein
MTTKIAAAILAAGAATVMAQNQAFNSDVIHDDTYIGAGYGLLYDIGNSGVNAHGVVAKGSYDIRNVVLGADAGYYWLDEGSSDLWQIAGSIGYVFRPMQNRLNITPSIGIAYAELDDVDATTVLPGIAVSYALCSRASVGVGYRYGFDVDDSDVDAHELQVGGQYALSEKVGLGVAASFVDGQGFAGLSALLNYHF